MIQTFADDTLVFYTSILSSNKRLKWFLHNVRFVSHAWRGSGAQSTEDVHAGSKSASRLAEYGAMLIHIVLKAPTVAQGAPELDQGVMEEGGLVWWIIMRLVGWKFVAQDGRRHFGLPLLDQTF